VFNVFELTEFIGTFWIRCGVRKRLVQKDFEMDKLPIGIRKWLMLFGYVYD
jgi:hypothetical protein